MSIHLRAAQRRKQHSCWSRNSGHWQRRCLLVRVDSLRSIEVSKKRPWIINRELKVSVLTCGKQLYSFEILGESNVQKHHPSHFKFQQRRCALWKVPKTWHFSAPKIDPHCLHTASDLSLSQGQVGYLHIGVTECCFWDQNLQASQQQLLCLIQFAGCFWMFFLWRFASHVFLRMTRLWSINNQRWPAAKAAMEAIRSTGNRLSSAVGAVGTQCRSRAQFISWLFACSQLPLGTATWRSDQARLKSHSNVWGLKEN